ncbi:TniB family NTP-binding protein [Sphingomonas sp. AR_OL41]|uniref:TniB family NTP-binding protein n=1 Tax=Sphingomonas sp. AR_OL41 TaxID=3042729 RepID=UPI00248187A0|nr:TniB family NTP-binding protein [Sphingomonas sp. AR_OL41]MDH7971296.1 TniB family NTP-binding protein [Sphingomonas sp. AR_OL41]
MNNFTEDFRDDPDHDDDTPLGSRLVARRRNVVRDIRVDWAPQREFIVALDELLYSAIERPGGPQAGVRLLAPSYSGKSTVARRYVSEVLERGEHRTDTIPVAYAKLDPEGTVGSLATDILKALGAKRPESLTPIKRWERARRTMRDKQVRLFLFDEFQRAGRRPTVSPVIAGKLLDVMDDEEGSCACAFIGKAAAKGIFKTAGDLGNRLDAPVHMQPLVWASKADREAFTKFADAFDEALVAGGATVVKSGLADPPVAELLMEASNGLIGQFSRIIETAVMNITRAGHTGIARGDLAIAVDEWSIGNERIDYNPFDRKVTRGGTASTADSARDDSGDPDGIDDGDIDDDGEEAGA